MNKEALETILHDSIEEFLRRDSYLLEKNIHEQAISHKLACYISKKIPPCSKKGWDVDVEYNRNIELPKSIIMDGKVKNKKPDILIHRRGLNNDGEIKNNNLLIIEIKKNTNHEGRDNDINKVKAFMKQPPYYYKYGAYIELRIGRPYKLTFLKKNDS